MSVIPSRDGEKFCLFILAWPWVVFHSREFLQLVTILTGFTASLARRSSTVTEPARGLSSVLCSRSSPLPSISSSVWEHLPPRTDSGPCWKLSWLANLDLPEHSAPCIANAFWHANLLGGHDQLESKIVLLFIDYPSSAPSLKILYNSTETSKFQASLMEKSLWPSVFLLLRY